MFTMFSDKTRSCSAGRFSQPQQYFPLTPNQPASQPAVFFSHAKLASHSASQPAEQGPGAECPDPDDRLAHRATTGSSCFFLFPYMMRSGSTWLQPSGRGFAKSGHHHGFHAVRQAPDRSPFFFSLSSGYDDHLICHLISSLVIR